MLTALMKRRLILLLLPVSLLYSSSLPPQAEEHSSVEALKKYILEKDYPEVFGDTHYHVRVEDILEVDIDNDGMKELVVQFYPHFRQSASVVLYKVSSESGVTRVTEGLAPGPLQKVSGDYLDSHKIGSGGDFYIGGASTTSGDAVKGILSAIANTGGAVVAYDDFYHLDGRKGNVWYVDMRGVKLPSHARDCSSFEFSKVRQIAAGHLREDSSKNYLGAWVGQEIYVFLIRGVSNRGLLDKELWVVKAPAYFNGFIPGQGLTYKTASGTALLTLRN